MKKYNHFLVNIIFVPKYFELKSLFQTELILCYLIIYSSIIIRDFFPHDIFKRPLHVALYPSKRKKITIRVITYYNIFVPYKATRVSTLSYLFKKFHWLLAFQNQRNHLWRFLVSVDLLDDSFIGFTLILLALFTAHSPKPGEETSSFIAFSVLSLVKFSNSSFVSFLLPSGVLWNEEGNVSESDNGTALGSFFIPENTI